MSQLKLNELKLKLGRILTGLEQHTEHVPVGEPAEDGQTSVVGVVNDPMARSLFSLSRSVCLYVNDYAEAHGLTEETVRGLTPEARAAHLACAKSVGPIVIAAETLFWGLVGQEIPEVFADFECDIHAGWRVSAKKSASRGSSHDARRELFKVPMFIGFREE